MFCNQIVPWQNEKWYCFFIFQRKKQLILQMNMRIIEIWNAKIGGKIGVKWETLQKKVKILKRKARKIRGFPLFPPIFPHTQAKVLYKRFLAKSKYNFLDIKRRHKPKMQDRDKNLAKIKVTKCNKNVVYKAGRRFFQKYKTFVTQEHFFGATYT